MSFHVLRSLRRSPLRRPVKVSIFQLSRGARLVEPDGADGKNSDERDGEEEEEEEEEGDTETVETRERKGETGKESENS